MFQFQLARLLPGFPASLVAAAWAAFFCLAPGATAAIGERITVSDGVFKAGADRIWINGANTPWHVWNDFGGAYNAAWWDAHFAKLHDNGINATRVWISCNGNVGVEIKPDGRVTGCTPQFWKDLDSLFDIAARHQVYIKATLISFDHFSSSAQNHNAWRAMLSDPALIDSVVTNYVKPFVLRYGSNPWLWCIDLCNEPDWIHENARCGKLPWDGVQTYVARSAAAIHSNSPVLVTLGIAMGPKYNGRGETNRFGDALLRSRAGGDPAAHLDFYSPHYYDWMERSWGNAFYKSPAAYGLDPAHPAIVGECPARGTRGHTVTEDYEAAFRNGWQGAMAWTSNGVDDNGGLPEMGPATRAFLQHHPALVFPPGPVSTTNAPGF